MELKGSKTEQNLLSAFAGESQARNKYTYYASKARKEGYNQIASIFEETANNEKEHAKIWFKLLHDGMPSTTENLKDAADIKVEDTLSQIGGGSLPTEKIKSKCISIVPKNISTTSLEEQLRLNENPVVARISDDKLIIDMRCILEDEIEILAEKIINILK